MFIHYLVMGKMRLSFIDSYLYIEMPFKAGLTTLYLHLQTLCDVWLLMSTGYMAKIRVTILNATLNNISVISWWLVLLVDEIGVLRENHRPVTGHWQTLSHNVVIEYISPWAGFELTSLAKDETLIYTPILKAHSIIIKQ
jgi:hypothetical protein